MIEITDLQKSFGDLQVLKGISVTIEDGEIYGLIGLSGAGKSTLLRCINGLESYTSGSLKVDGVEVKDLNRKQLKNFRKEVSMIFQHFPMLSRKTVYENIAFPMKCWRYKKDEIDKKVHELAKLVGIEEKLNERPRSLSGGQLQRVAIARALTMEPKLLLCDEATSALDPTTTKSILQLLRDINDQLGITIIVVAHQMSVIKDICTKVALLEEGKLVASGDVEDLFLNRTPELERFLDTDNVPEAKSGVTIQVMILEQDDSKNVLSRMVRDLDVDFSVISGEMDRYRDDYLGSLNLNFSEEDIDRVTAYLDDHNVVWHPCNKTPKE